MKVRFEELWEPWEIGDQVPEWCKYPDEWPIPEDLADRFRKAKSEIEEVWDLMRVYNPDIYD